MEALSPTSSIRAFIEPFVVGKIKCAYFFFIFKNVLLYKLNHAEHPNRRTSKPLNPWNWLTEPMEFDRTQVMNYWSRGIHAFLNNTEFRRLTDLDSTVEIFNRIRWILRNHCDMRIFIQFYPWPFQFQGAVRHSGSKLVDHHRCVALNRLGTTGLAEWLSIWRIWLRVVEYSGRDCYLLTNIAVLLVPVVLVCLRGGMRTSEEEGGGGGGGSIAVASMSTQGIVAWTSYFLFNLVGWK